MICCLEFFKDGKYDLDFKNKDSDPSKWVSNMHTTLDMDPP